MPTICSSYRSDEEARAAVDRLLAAGSSHAEIRVLTGEPVRDHRDEPIGGFAGGDASAKPVGTFADQDGTTSETMGTYAGDGGRVGGFGDLDRETVTTYADGVRRVHIASHGKLQRMLVDAGLDEASARADVEALHAGRVLVLARLSAMDADDAASLMAGAG